MSARKELVVPAGLLRRLAEEHGTPLYVYDLPTMRSRVAELAGFDVVRYALKANSNLSVLALSSKRRPSR
jgi:diaminopimelate decarboxylase